MTSDFWVGRQVKLHLILLNTLMQYLMRVGRQVKNDQKTSDVIHECSLIHKQTMKKSTNLEKRSPNCQQAKTNVTRQNLENMHLCAVSLVYYKSIDTCALFIVCSLILEAQSMKKSKVKHKIHTYYVVKKSKIYYETQK